MQDNTRRTQQTNTSSVKLFIFVLAIFFCRSLAATSHESIGDILEFALPGAAVGISVIKKDWQGTSQVARTLIATRLTVFAMKKLIDAERPNGSSKSFPSGHTAISFAAAGFMQKRYGWKCGIAFLIAASYVGFSRIDARAHWIQDVIAGAAIGWVYSRFFVTPKVTITANSSSLGVNCAF